MSSNNSQSGKAARAGFFPTLTSVPGVEIGAVAAGLRYQGRPDLMMARLGPKTTVAGVFTQNQIKAAPVRWCIDAMQETGGRARGLVVNAGSANAFTGARGVSAARRVAEMAAENLDCEPNEIMMASTGVIGEPFSATPVARPMARLVGGLSGGLWRDAARAITTTDTFAKGSSRIAEVGSVPVILTGIAKGAGMIAPSMATMLSFIFTNANITADCLDAILREANEASFNAVTVDGDTSTNDTVLLFATGEQGGPEISKPNDKRLKDFKRALADLMSELAQQIARDGEGANRMIAVNVVGAASVEDARAVALSIANSNLVKTAIAGGDANWGRILMAAGNAGVPFKETAISLHIGDQLCASGGSVQRAFDEEEAAAHLAEETVKITLDLSMGSKTATAWTCDLTAEYIAINADYRS